MQTFRFRVEVINNGFLIHIYEGEDAGDLPLITEYAIDSMAIGNLIQTFMNNRNIYPPNKAI